MRGVYTDNSKEPKVIKNKGRERKCEMGMNIPERTGDLKNTAKKTPMSPWCGLGVSAECGQTVQLFHHLF